MPDDKAGAVAPAENRLSTRSDEWLALLLGDDLRTAMLRLFAGVAVALAIGATAAHLASR